MDLAVLVLAKSNPPQLRFKYYARARQGLSDFFPSADGGV